MLFLEKLYGYPSCKGFITFSWNYSLNSVSNPHSASYVKGPDLHVSSTGCSAGLLQNALRFPARVSEAGINFPVFVRYLPIVVLWFPKGIGFINIVECS